MHGLATRRGGAVDAEIREVAELGGRPVAWFRLSGGKHHGAIGTVEGETLVRLVKTAVDAGVPIVGVIDSSGADVTEGVAALAAWGRAARALTEASGMVPIVFVVVGPCVSGPALLLGLADVVVMTSDAFAYVSGPAAVQRTTAVELTHATLGGSSVHAVRSGVATLLASDEDDAVLCALDVLAYLPANNAELPPLLHTDDPVDRDCTVAVPPGAGTPYDVRPVVADVVDRGSLLELQPRFGASVVTALATIDGHPVGVVANQPDHMAGTLTIESSQKAAGFVQLCDAFNVPLITFVDTPGYQPGKDIEWRGIIRHGAQLVHAYASATVPRVCVILRKAYGGAYIVMDSQGVGSDACFAWPSAEIAVMGAKGAVQILHRGVTDARLRAQLEADYAARYCTPEVAAERGFVDEVTDPVDTRRRVAFALRALRTKRERLPRRRHSNCPL